MMNQISSESYQRKIRILGIAPYEGMKSIMQKISAERPEIELDVFVGDLQKGVEITRRNLLNHYDVIISRGGTAELIGKITHIPVIEVGISFYDILRAIKLSENYSDRYAIVGFPGITGSAHLLCELLQYRIDIFTIHNQSEVQDTLTELKAKGYKMVLCDMITDTIAKHLGLNAILITSGAESISNAFDQAVRLTSSCADSKAENQFFSDILRNANEHTIVLKENGEIFFSTLDEEETSGLYDTLTHEIQSVLEKRTQKFFKNIDGTLYSFLCKRLTFLGELYAAFYFSSSPVPFATSKYGIQYSNQQEAEDHFFNSFYSLTNATNNMRSTIENINQTSFPVMLSGEAGSGKEQVARDIYSRSRFSGNPLITVDCAQLNDRSWNFLTNHYNSPFNDNNNTIFLKDITALTKERRQQLLSLIIDTNLCKRNRMIFSCNCPLGQGIPAEAMEYVNLLSCLTLHLPPLREHVSEIPALSSLYLSTINVSTASQIIGLEPQALELLQNYSWPYNYTQFKRILNELALVTTTPYIQAEHVAALLEKEQEQTASAAQPSDIVSVQGTLPEGFHTLDLSRPLDEITQEIIRLVMADCKGKQSAAAKSLGIGRSTIWRYLK